LPAAAFAAGNALDRAMTVRHALAVAALICWTGAEPTPMKFTTLGRGDLSRIEDSRDVVVRTAAEWSTLWQEHAGKGKPPAVDFTRSIVIAVFLGSRQSAGYTVEITRIEKDGTGLVVTSREQRPAPGDMVAQMLTSPFHIVRTDAHSGPVRFTRTR
jgi:hypothetical protein